MIEPWKFDDGTEVGSREAAVEGLRTRIGAGALENTLTNASGRTLVVVTNGERALVMLLECEGDPGEHAVDPGAVGASSGFVLTNGQHDEYAHEDTVPLSEAFGIVAHIVGDGVAPASSAWAVDR